MTCHSAGVHRTCKHRADSYKPQILIVGRSLTAQVLCKLGKAIGYRVNVVAPGATRESFPDADLIIDELDLSQVKITPETYVVVSTQGEHDEEALEQALRANTSYVSFIASVLKARKVFDFLITKGLAPESLSRIKAPAGLNIGASSSQEIAVSILAEIVQARKSKMTALDIEDVPVDKSALVNAQDPVCGMAVETSVANYLSEYKGKTFYFCCSGCKQTFDKQPEVYAEGVR